MLVDRSFIPFLEIPVVVLADIFRGDLSDLHFVQVIKEVTTGRSWLRER